MEGWSFCEALLFLKSKVTAVLGQWLEISRHCSRGSGTGHCESWQLNIPENLENTLVTLMLVSQL